jgi:PhnB protein
MSQVATYLNFNRNTEEAFTFYKSVFGTEFMGIMRHGDVPVPDDQPGPSDEDKNLIINIADVPDSMGFSVNQGNNVHICLMPETRTEADRLFAALSEGGKVEMPMQDMFWGDYFGSFADKFGINWMINCSEKP